MQPIFAGEGEESEVYSWELHAIFFLNKVGYVETISCW
jgi:hypothetical protein